MKYIMLFACTACMLCLYAESDNSSHTQQHKVSQVEEQSTTGVSSDMIYSDISDKLMHHEAPDAPSTHTSSEFPKHPLDAIVQTKECPVDHNISYKKSSDMNLEEAYTARIYYLWKQHIDPAIHVLKRILILEENQELRARHMLELGDLYQSKAYYADAQSVYDAFIQQYPGSVYLEYAYYQLLMCHYHNMSEPDKDQSETHKVIEEATNYLSLFTNAGHYAQHVHDLRNYAYQRLYKSELVTLEFYVNKYTYTSAASSLRAAYYRLQYIYDHIVMHLPQQKSRRAQAIIAHALNNIAIDTLSHADDNQNNIIYQQLNNTLHELQNVVEGDDTARSWWHINPLRRF